MELEREREREKRANRSEPRQLINVGLNGALIKDFVSADSS